MLEHSESWAERLGTWADVCEEPTGCSKVLLRSLEFICPRVHPDCREWGVEGLRAGWAGSARRVKSHRKGCSWQESVCVQPPEVSRRQLSTHVPQAPVQFGEHT